VARKAEDNAETLRARSFAEEREEEKQIHRAKVLATLGMTIFE